MFFLLTLIGVAVGAVVGGLATHAAGEGDRRSAKHQRDIANDLITKHTKLEQRYSE